MSDVRPAGGRAGQTLLNSAGLLPFRLRADRPGELVSTGRLED